MSQGGTSRTALPYIPALDGVRGIAIAAVLVYHLDRAWLPGGMLGITVFFTLSGFLITSLILRELDQTGRLALSDFWLRRARRLVPASLAAVALIALLTRLAGAAVDRDVIGDAVAALTWTANWRFVADGTSYADLFEDPSPFQHFWSLAVEEQLYVALPLLAVSLCGGGRRRWPLALVLTGGVIASTVAGILLHQPGTSPGRAYFGTDARIAEPLVGALLALVLVHATGLRRLSRAATRFVGLLGVLGLGAIAWLMWNISTGDAVLHRGGFLATALATAVVIAAVTQTTTVARVLSAAPLVALGRISYGVYLFHWPLFLYLDDRLRDRGRLTVVCAQLGGALLVAVVSYSFLELPIRRRERDARVFAVGWANATVAVVAVVALSSMSITATASGPLDLGVAAGAPAPPPPAEVRAFAAPAVARGGDAARARGQPPAAPVATPGTASPVDVEDDPVVGGQGRADDHTAPPPEHRGTELRVVVVGDSLGHNVAVGLKSWADSQGDVLVYNVAMSACPVSRGGDRRFDEYETFPVNPACAWWDDPWSDRSQNIAAFAPDVVVIEASLNELLDRRLPEWREWRRPGEPAYHHWLLGEYNRFFAAIRGLAGEDAEFPAAQRGVRRLRPARALAQGRRCRRPRHCPQPIGVPVDGRVAPR